MEKDENKDHINKSIETEKGQGYVNPNAIYDKLREVIRDLEKNVLELTSEAQAQALLQKDQQERLLMEAPFGTCVLDGPELVFQFINPTYQKIFPGRELLGKPLMIALPELSGTQIPSILENVYRTGETFVKHEHLIHVARSAGMPLEEIFVNFSYQARLNTKGEVDGILVFVYEITEQVLAKHVLESSIERANTLADELATANQKLHVTNQELDVTNQHLIRTNIDLDNFIYTASHDLKAPILNIEGLMGILVHELPREVQSGNVEKITHMILDSVNRFKQTLLNLTDLASLQQLEEEESQVNLAEMVQDVQLDIDMQLKEAKAQIEVDVDNNFTIPFSAKNLRSILYNLLSNAVKYRSPDRQPLIKVSGYETDDYLVLSVQDNGLGMDLDKDNGLFQRYRRLHNHVEGTGIGLFMVKRIIDNAGAKIKVQSKVGEGSTFKVFFRRTV